MKLAKVFDGCKYAIEVIRGIDVLKYAYPCKKYKQHEKNKYGKCKYYKYKSKGVK